MLTIGIHTQAGDLRRLAYVIDYLNNHPYSKAAEIEFELNVKCEIDIAYAAEKAGPQTFMPKANFIFADKKEGFLINEYSHGTQKVYSVEGVKKHPQTFLENGVYGFDVFETIFFHLSRYEEREIEFSDYLTDRLSFERKLLLIKSGLEKTPVVDELVKSFIESLTKKSIKIQPSIFLSHDIDYITKFKSPLSIFRKIAGHFRHRKSVRGFTFLWNTYKEYLFDGRDGFDTFDWMLSEKNGDKCIYYLVGGRHKEDNQFDLNGKVFRKSLELAKERNYEVGIHPSYESWNNLDLIKEQKELLEDVVGKEIVRGRQHFLNFDINITPKFLENTGIREDASLGFTRHTGYRCGTGFVFKLYDFESEKAFDVVEKPLVFMDTAWLFESMRKDNFDLPDLSKLYGGFNFHNSTFDEMGARSIDMKGHYLGYFGLSPREM